MTRVTAGRSRSGYDGDVKIAVELSNGTTLDLEQAAWLRDRLDEELALLHGSEITSETPAIEDVPDTTHSKEAMGTIGPGDEADESDDDASSEDVEEDETVCPECGEEFASPRGVTIHQTKTHGDDGDGGEEHACPTCGRVFDTSVGMKTHHHRVHDVTVDELPDDHDDPEANAEAADGGAEPEVDDSGDDPGAAALRRRIDDRNGTVDDGKGGQDASDASDDDQHQPDLPFGCPVVDCPKRFDDREDRRTHRDNAHDEVAVLRGYRERCREDLPREISVAAVQRAVVANTRVGEIADGLCVEKSDARKWINMLQLTDAKNEHSEAQAVHLIEDLHDELGIDEPVPAMPGEGDDSRGERA